MKTKAKPNPKCVCGHTKAKHQNWWPEHKSACFHSRKGNYTCPCVRFKEAK